METITAIGFLLSLASALGVVLAIANARLKVFEDPRIDEVDEMNLGADWVAYVVQSRGVPDLDGALPDSSVPRIPQGQFFSP